MTLLALRSIKYSSQVTDRNIKWKVMKCWMTCIAMALKCLVELAFFIIVIIIIIIITTVTIVLLHQISLLILAVS